MELTEYQKGLALYIMEAENKGQAIKELRKINNITQIELAERLGYSNSSTVADVEAARNGMNVDLLLRYVVALSKEGSGKKKKTGKRPKCLRSA